jgi:hypothetical protein
MRMNRVTFACLGVWLAALSYLVATIGLVPLWQPATVHVVGLSMFARAFVPSRVWARGAR